MALGILKQVGNIGHRFGSQDHYQFVKVASKGRGENGEEYWLVTDDEVDRFSTRGLLNQEDWPNLKRGVIAYVDNKKRKFGAAQDYLAVMVQGEAQKVCWLLTAFDLEILRLRAESNSEDIQANKESWLADLLD